MPEPLVEKPRFCYLVSSLCGVSLFFFFGVFLSWVSLEFKGLFILLHLIFAQLLYTTDFNENIIEIFYTYYKIHPFKVYSEFLLGWHKSGYNFCIVAIWPLILKYILSKCGYVIHHFNAYFSLCVFLLMTYYLLFIFCLFRLGKKC